MDKSGGGAKPSGAGGGTGDCRREKSLGLLSQKFVQLFLVSRARVVSLESAARTLLGSCADQAKLKTKVRRLYDIANILSSCGSSTHLVTRANPRFDGSASRGSGAASGGGGGGQGGTRPRPPPRPPPPRTFAATAVQSSGAPAGAPRSTQWFAQRGGRAMTPPVPRVGSPFDAAASMAAMPPRRTTASVGGSRATGSSRQVQARPGADHRDRTRRVVHVGPGRLSARGARWATRLGRASRRRRLAVAPGLDALSAAGWIVRGRRLDGAGGLPAPVASRPLPGGRGSSVAGVARVRPDDGGDGRGRHASPAPAPDAARSGRAAGDLARWDRGRR